MVGELQGLGRYSGPATLILTSLAEGPKHGYALTKDIERFAGTHLAPGRCTPHWTDWLTVDSSSDLKPREGVALIGLPDLGQPLYGIS